MGHYVTLLSDKPTINPPTRHLGICYIQHRQVNVKTNYRNGFSNLLCRLCEKPGEVESEIHLMSCEKILMESGIKEKLEKIAFSDIFGPMEKQISAIKV
jgi:hypothetical protein